MRTQVVTGSAVHGWLTFAVPSDQQAIGLIWRLRSAVPLSDQGGGDQAMSIPLTVGSTATAGLGTAAPPAGIPIDPNSPVPPGPVSEPQWSAVVGPIERAEHYAARRHRSNERLTMVRSQQVPSVRSPLQAAGAPSRCVTVGVDRRNLQRNYREA